MAEFNTVCLSWVLRSKVEVYKKEGLQVARFFIGVERAGAARSLGNFEVVAFSDLAEGDHLVGRE